MFRNINCKKRLKPPHNVQFQIKSNYFYFIQSFSNLYLSPKKRIEKRKKFANSYFLTGLRTNSTMGDKKAQKLGFAESFMLSGVAAGVSKTAAAPIERVKLLVQNQDEMIKQGRLDKPYTGVIDCTTRVLKTEGVYPFWRGKS